MRKYQIFLMEKEIAHHYFGKESKLFHLFLESQTVSGEQLALVKKQIDYIIRPIPTILVHQVVDETLRYSTHYSFYLHSHYIDKKQSKAKLTVFDTNVVLTAEGTYEAETMFFESLRKIDPRFLAMDFENFKFGWLNPIKQAELI
ncbi:sporulation inhibitor of replication protein SirA [Anaerobacillus sp. MEB173]|uniref:sporulation inhibitor of replication protein SirA n=1 Tax=Anaerobacillus sp. MEB173 TaxID=3383345 RepID=UPI003F8F3A14